MKNRSDEQQTYNAIDLLKFLCAILVVMIHIKPFGSVDEIGIVDYLNFGVQNYFARIAVPFFFVTSGYFLYRKTSLEEYDFNHAVNYARRILRLYLIWTIVYFPLSILQYYANGRGIFHIVFAYTRNVIFVGSYLHLWYLPALVFAVVIVSFLLYRKVKLKSIILLSGFFYAIGLLAQSWFGLIVPLRETMPQVWTLLQVFEKVIVTTRDGLFEGFFFVSLGMYLAFCPIKISKIKAILGFVISMLAMLFEAFGLEYIKYAREHDMYIFLVPATFFLFCFAKEVRLVDKPIYKVLRSLSSLIFYSHLWVEVFVAKLLRMIDEQLAVSYIRFICTLVVTIIISLVIIWMAEKKQIKWLKKLYA